MPDSPFDDRIDLAAQDEVLQVMYWLRGEGLASDVGPADVARFTGAADSSVASILDRLVERGLVRVVRSDVGARFTLTADGMREGGRRFADEFADLTKAGHGECNDPDCECKQTGHPEDCRHRA